MPETSLGILNQIERFYEISQESLEIGYNVTLTNNSAFETIINGKNKYIIANNFSKDVINLIFIGKGKILFNRKLTSGNYVIFKIGDRNLQFTLHSSRNKTAKIELKLFKQKIPTNVSYFELFDIQVRIDQHEIYRPSDLSATIEFTNFGEGPTYVRLIYSIIDTSGKEYFTKIEQKVIETNEIIRKNFDKLKIPNGNYLLKATIYYGKNQEATSEESFTLKPIPITQLLKQPLIFISIILTAFTLILFFKKRKYATSQNQQL
jgi:hypothetical protein